MKWVSVNNSSTSHHYELWDTEKKLIGLSISNRTRITRIESASDKRLFFIEKKGFLQSRTVIKNEYGIHMGELHSETRETDKGIIELDGRKYTYALSDHANEELIIYDENTGKPLVSCSLSPDYDDVSAIVKRSKSLHDTDYPSLLMALCWYLLKGAAAEMKSMA